MRSQFFISMILIIFCFSFIFWACEGGAGKTLVLEPVERELIRVNALEFVHGKSTVEIPAEVINAFEGYLDEFLFEKGEFKRGNDLKIIYRFIQYDKGDRFLRFFTGSYAPETGLGSLTIEACYFNRAKKQVGMIQCEGEISSGSFGGDFDIAIKEAAQEVADYTLKYFKGR